MTKRGLDALLANLNIYETKEIADKDIKDYKLDQIHHDEAGKAYIIEKGELESSDINTVLLAKIFQGVKTIRAACIFFIFAFIIIGIMLYIFIFMR